MFSYDNFKADYCTCFLYTRINNATLKIKLFQYKFYDNKTINELFSFPGKYYVSLIEVKSTCDDVNSGLMVSNPTSIKNNKRSGLHQLRDHVEILEKSCGIPKDSLHCYLFWPFLTMWTKDPTGQRIQRWREEGDKHVFTDTISDQKAFNDWFYANILDGKSIEKIHFDALFKRYI